MAFYLRARCCRWPWSWPRDDPAYEDMASKFFEHFVAIADAMNTLGGTGLWDEEDGFYYDQLHVDGPDIPLRIRSLVGLIPLFAVEVLDDGLIASPARLQEADGVVPRQPPRSGRARSRYHGACRTTGATATATACWPSPPASGSERVLRYVLDENEFLSPYGIRSLSRVHRDHPFVLHASAATKHRVDYEPGESTTRPVRRQLELARARSGSR